MLDETVTTPFVYLIGWPDHNRFYLGVRFAKGCNPADMWMRYFTSSKVVHAFAELHGPPPVIDIVKTFDNAKDAWQHEADLLDANQVHKLNNFLNKSAGHGYSLTAESQAKRSATRVQSYKDNPELRERMSASVKASWDRDPERKAKLAERFSAMIADPSFSRGNIDRQPKRYEFKGEIKTLEQWAEDVPASAHQINVRLNQGWDFERALTAPVRKRSASKR